MTRMERVTIRDIPLSKAPSSPIPKAEPARKMSDRTWTFLRIGGAALIISGLALASNVLSPSMTGAVAAASRNIDAGLVSGVIGLALVATIALSAVMDHED